MSDEQEWCRPLPEVLPRPTYSPAIFGLGMSLVFFGLVTSWIVSLAGLLLCFVGGADWIGELRNERVEAERVAAGGGDAAHH